MDTTEDKTENCPSPSGTSGFPDDADVAATSNLEATANDVDQVAEENERKHRLSTSDSFDTAQPMTVTSHQKHSLLPRWSPRTVSRKRFSLRISWTLPQIPPLVTPPTMSKRLPISSARQITGKAKLPLMHHRAAHIVRLQRHPPH